MASVSTALISFLFIGLNVTRLRLSRDEMETKLRQRLKEVAELREELTYMRRKEQDYERKLELLQLCRPLGRQSHYRFRRILAAYKQDQEKNSHEREPTILNLAETRENKPKSESKIGEMPASPSHNTNPAAAGDTGPSIHLSTPANSAAGGDAPHVSISGRASIMIPIEHLDPESKSKPHDPNAATGMNLTLADMMRHPYCVEYLKDKMGQNFAAESLSFYLDVQNYKTRVCSSRDVIGGHTEDVGAHHSHSTAENKEKEKKEAALEIYNTYIVQGSKYEVNLSSELRAKVKSKVIISGTPKATCFDDAENEIVSLILTNDFPRLLTAEGDELAMCAQLLRVYKPIPPYQKAVMRSKTTEDFGGEQSQNHRESAERPKSEAPTPSYGASRPSRAE
jgi:hypothetical protein